MSYRNNQTYGKWLYLRDKTQIHDVRVSGIGLPVVESVVEIFRESETKFLELSHAHHRAGRTGGDGAALDRRHDRSQSIEFLKIKQIT
jgi:hypothetical protein